MLEGIRSHRGPSMKGINCLLIAFVELCFLMSKTRMDNYFVMVDYTWNSKRGYRRNQGVPFPHHLRCGMDGNR